MKDMMKQKMPAMKTAEDIKKISEHEAAKVKDMGEDAAMGHKKISISKEDFMHSANMSGVKRKAGC